MFVQKLQEQNESGQKEEEQLIEQEELDEEQQEKEGCIDQTVVAVARLP